MILFTNDCSALHWACDRGHMVLSVLLVQDLGANVNLLVSFVLLQEEFCVDIVNYPSRCFRSLLYGTRLDALDAFDALDA